jgi:enoyl-[acyl-carrier protein] reductase II
MCLIPAVCQHVHVPVIAAGGIASGKAMLAAFALGAEGVQIGSRFVASQESSAHLKYKEALIHTKEGDTEIRLKSVTPVRLLKNNFYQQVKTAEENGASPEELRQLLGKGRAKRGMFEGELDNGELEIGQVSAQINTILPAKEILNEIWQEFLFEKDQLSNR